MTKGALKNILSGSFWGVISKVVDSFTKFISIPLLIAHYGKMDFGLFVLAFSLNSYLRLLDLGMNTGGVRFFAIWFSTEEKGKILRLSQSSVLIYGWIGVANALVFLILGYFAETLFHISGEQVQVFRTMMYILAVAGMVNWATYVVEQLLTAIEEFGWLSRVRVVASLLSFATVFMAISFDLGIEGYFLLYTVSSSLLIIPFNVLRLNRTHLPVGELVRPRWHRKDFMEVFRYSLALFAMGIFQVTSDTIRPVLLGMFATAGIDILADFRIVQTIALFVLSIGSVFFGMLLPISSKSYAQDDIRTKELIVFQGTKAITAFMCLVIFGIMMNADYILLTYVGAEYVHLSLWLDIWLLTLLINMHTYPVSSLIFSAGKTRPLVWSSAIGCIASVVLTIVFAPDLGVGAAVLGYLAFVVVNNLYTYIFYIPVVLKLNAKRIFVNNFLSVVIVAVGCTLASMALDRLIHPDNVHVSMVLRSGIFVVSFAAGIYVLLTSQEEAAEIRKFLFRSRPIGFMK